MNIAFAILAGIFLSVAVFLLLSRSLIRVVLGLVILGNAVNLLILVAGRLTRAAPPILGPAGAPAQAVANPLPQALILTAIVIGFGLVTFMIVLAWQALAAFGVDDTGAMRLAEPEMPPIGPADY